MNCGTAKTLIRESSAQGLGEDPELQRHIDRCDSCSREHRLRLMTSQSLAAATGGVHAGRQFTMRVLDSLDREAGWPEEPGKREAISWSALLRPSPVWAALALVLVLISGYNYMRTIGYFAPAGEIPANMGHFVEGACHDAFLHSRDNQSLELLTGDPARVREWFSARLDYPVNVPAGLYGGYRLEGVRLWHTVLRLSAFARYQTPGGEPVALFVVSPENLADQGTRKVEWDGRTYHVGDSFRYNAVAWKESGVAYALVGGLDINALVRMAEGFRP